MLLAVMAQPVEAGTCSTTDLPSSGTLTASRLDSRHAQLEACINGNIGNTNWDATDPLAIGNIANDLSTFAISTQLACGTVVSAYQFRVPVSSTLMGASFRCRGCTAADHDVSIQVNGSTVKTFAAIADSTTNTDFALATAVSNAVDVEIDTTQTTAGSCTAYDVVIYFTAQHTS